MISSLKLQKNEVGTMNNFPQVILTFIVFANQFCYGIERAAAITKLVYQDRQTYFELVPGDLRSLILGMNSLHIACKDGQFERVQTFWEEGADMNVQDIFCRTPFYIACENGHCTIVRFLLRRSPDITKKQKLNPLHIASVNGHVDVVTVLLENGASINAVDENGKSALYHASENGSFHVVESLLRSGANLYLRTTDRQTALHRSAEKGYAQIVKLLLAAGADVEGKVPGELVCSWMRRPRCFTLLRMVIVKLLRNY